MRRAPVDPGRNLRKAIECLASYKMVPAVYGLPNTTGSLPIAGSCLRISLVNAGA